MLVRFIINKDCGIYRKGDVFGTFDVDNWNDAKMMRCEIEDVYNVSVDYVLYGKED